MYVPKTAYKKGTELSLAPRLFRCCGQGACRAGRWRALAGERQRDISHWYAYFSFPIVMVSFYKGKLQVMHRYGTWMTPVVRPHVTPRCRSRRASGGCGQPSGSCHIRYAHYRHKYLGKKTRLYLNHLNFPFYICLSNPQCMSTIIL